MNTARYLPMLAFAALCVLSNCRNEPQSPGAASPAEHVAAADTLRDTLQAKKMVKRAVALFHAADYRQAIELARQANAVFQNQPEQTQGSRRGSIACLDLIGHVYTARGEFDEALKVQLELLAQTPAVFDSIAPEVGALHVSIGRTYFKMWNDSRALWHLHKGKAILEGRLGKNHPTLAVVYENLGGVYITKGEVEKARDLLKHALDIHTSSNSPDSVNMAQAALSLSIAYLKLNRMELGLETANLALNLRIAMFGKRHPEVANAYLFLAETLLKMGNYNQAYTYIQSALVAIGYSNARSLNASNALPMLPYLLEFQGRMYRHWFSSAGDLSKLHLSRKLFLDATTVLEWRAERLSPDSKSAFSNQAHDIYEGLVHTCYRLYRHTDSADYAREAFYYSEKAKSVQLYEAVVESQALAFSGIPDSLIQQDYQYRRAIAELEQRLQTNLEHKLNRRDTSIAGLLASLSSLNKKRDQLKNTLKKDYPQYYSAAKELPVMSVPEVQQTLLAPGQALLEYFVGDSMFIFAIRSDTFRVAVNPLPKSDLKAKVEAMRAGLFERNNEQYARAALELYQLLVAPVQDFIRDQNLLIIPDGELGYLPFDALLLEMPENLAAFRTYEYLLNRHTTSICYSATLLREMRQKRRQRPPAKVFLGVAPEFSGQPNALAARGGEVPENQTELAPLDWNADEVRDIQRRLGGDLLTGNRANEQAFCRMAGNYRILHLSTHAEANDLMGDYAYLAFYEKSDSLEHNRLYNRELYNLQLNADLVVLSACETGAGELRRGEGIISLARGVSYAGAKSIVTTLWKIREPETFELMQRFYRNLQQPGMRKDEALRQAKRALIEKTANVHPLAWAAFIPIGDMTPMDLPAPFPWPWLLAGLGALALAVGLFVWRRRRVV